MQGKLQPKDICRYISYGLKGLLIRECKEDFAWQDWAEDLSIFEKGTVWEYIGHIKKGYNIPIGEGELEDYLYGRGTTYSCLIGVKPILFPSNNLTTPITVKGKTITPLLELAKIACPFSSEEITSFEFENEGDISFLNLIKRDVVIYCLEFRNGNFYTESKYDRFLSQSQLFDWMDEHFIDYRGLILRGLAVDVLTLNENCYG